MEENKRPAPSLSSGAIHPKVVRRAAILLGIAACLFLLLLLRILLLQTVGYDRYQKNVIDQMTTESVVAAERGNIYDRNGVLLATDVTTYRVFLSPSAIATAQKRINESGDNVQLDHVIAERLSGVLSVSEEFILQQTTYTRYLDRTLKKGVDKETASRVREIIAEYGWHQLIYLEATSTRYYPYSTLASHVLGFTGSDNTGLYGLEYYYNEVLSGTNGKYITARDAQGNEMPYEYEEYIAEKNGYHLTTTLDVFVQSALEEQLKTAYTESGGKNRASGAVMNVNTGEVLGMAVYPAFDLNDPWTLDSDSEIRLIESGYENGSDDYQKLKQELLLTMWSNKILTESYIPGSTFKVITASMALEENAVSETETFNCPGYKKVADRIIHCHKTTGHGTLTFRGGIQQSCNPVLMTVGLRVGITNFYKYLKAFGYLEQTGIDLPGEGYSVIRPEKDCTELDLAIYSFGQNFNVTMIQQLTAVSAVANGGYLVTPHLLKTVTDDTGAVIKSAGTDVRRQAVSTKVCREVADILEDGVSGDGGAKNAYVAGYRVAAKTGTSEVKEAGREGQYICSTVAFAPADDPQYAIIIVVDHPTQGSLYGSTVAAPYVANTLEIILPYLGVEADYTEEEQKNLTVAVPSVLANSVATAKSRCAKLGLSVEVIGDSDGVIRKQYPVAGTVLEKASGKVIVYTESGSEPETVIVPNVIDMSAVAANQTIVNAGLNIRILGTKNYLTGTGVKAIAQSVAAGTEVARGSVIEVTFRYLEDEDCVSYLDE